MSGREKGKRSAQSGLATAGVAALAVVCCAALPLLFAFAGSVAIGTVLGVGVGVAAAAGLAAAIVLRARMRRSSTRRTESPPQGSYRGS